MCKTSGFRKTLAILLALLMAFSVLGTAASAEGEESLTYNRVWTYTNIVDPGEYWYNCRELADATGTEVYRYNSEFYLSTDGEVLKIICKPEGGEQTTEYHRKDTESAYFDYLYVLPAFGEALPTSPDGLADGAYWFDHAGLVESVSRYLSSEYMYMYEDATFHLSVDGKILRRIYMTPYGFTSKDDERLDEDYGVMIPFLHVVGEADPNEGFTLLPSSDEGLADGAYWYDANALADYLGSEDGQYYRTAKYYLSDDGATLRIEIFGRHTDVPLSVEYGGLYANFLKQKGVDPLAGFTQLPISDEGLETGAYWFDAAGLAEYMEKADYATYAYYLSADGKTLHIERENIGQNYDAASYEGMLYFGFLRQVGVDPNAGFESVFFSKDDVPAGGGYLFDLEAYLAYYIEDTNALRASRGEAPLTEQEIEAEREEMNEAFAVTQMFYDPQGARIKIVQGPYSLVYPAGNENYEEIIAFISYYVPGADSGKTALWAGYEQDVVDAGILTESTAHYIYVLVGKGKSGTGPVKVQIRSANGTMTYTREHPSVKAKTDVVYNGADCELWQINRGTALLDGAYTAVAKYEMSVSFNDIADDTGAAFEVKAPEVLIDTAVYDVDIAVRDEDYVVTFDGTTKQVITVVTGADVTKVQLVNTKDDGTMTFNRSNASVTEDQLADGTNVLVWKITRLFAKGDWSFIINVRTAQMGLTDSGKTLQFSVQSKEKPLADTEKLLSVNAVVGENGAVAFTVKTAAAATKIKFTNIDDNGTMTFGRDHSKVVIDDSANDGTITWTITIGHTQGTSYRYNVQALAEGLYSSPKVITVRVPIED